MKLCLELEILGRSVIENQKVAWNSKDMIALMIFKEVEF